MINIFEPDKGVYAIGTVARLIEEHPETLRVWERNQLIFPDRESYQRKYSNNDLARLKFIKYLIDQKGLNIAGVKQIIAMYPCWKNRNCKGGALKNSPVQINEAKPCWKIEGTFCYVPDDKADMCSSCERKKFCKENSASECS